MQAGVPWETRVTQTRTQDVAYLCVIRRFTASSGGKHPGSGGRERWGHNPAIDVLCDLIKGQPLSGPELFFL